MTRALAALVLAALVPVVPTRADDPPKKLTPDERKKLVAQVRELNDAGVELLRARKVDEAAATFEKALALARRVYPKDEFPDGHPDLARVLRNLASTRQDQLDYEEAEALAREALAMRRRLYPKQDHADVVDSLNSLGFLLQADRRYEDAEPLFREALDISRRLFPNRDHADLAQSVNNVAFVLRARGKAAEAEVLFREAHEMYRRLYPKQDHRSVATSLNNVGAAVNDQRRYAEAEQLYREALEMRRRLYPKQDHPEVARSLTNVADVLDSQGKFTEAEALYREALAMRRRLYPKIDHPDIAASLTNLAFLLRERGNWAEAELLHRESLEMARRRARGDDPAVAQRLNDLAAILKAQGKYAAAEPIFRQAHDMYQRLYPEKDRADVARSIHDLGIVLHDLARYAEAEKLLRAALEMHRRVYPDQDHPRVAVCLTTLATVLADQGKHGDAVALAEQALEMNKRLYPGRPHHNTCACLTTLGQFHSDRGDYPRAEQHFRDALEMARKLDPDLTHPDVAGALHDLGAVLQARGKHADAEPLLKESLGLHRTMLASYAAVKPEGETLTLLAAGPFTLDRVLTNARVLRAPGDRVYPEVWASKAEVGRVYERRLQAARAVTDPKTAGMLAALAEARRRRAELILAPEVDDPVTHQRREQAITELGLKIAELDRVTRRLLPAIERAERLAKATPGDLQKVLPADAAVVDFLRYAYFEPPGDKRAEGAHDATESYLVFVITRDRIGWIDLGPADQIEDAVKLWREAIISRKEIPAAIPARVRELVWAKVREQLPAGVRTVHLSPDLALCRVPWAALPGDRPGTVLLEDFAIATVPHAPFLLDQFGQPEERPPGPGGVLVVGGVDYQAAPASGAPADPGPPVKPKTKRPWGSLAGTAAEATGVADAAARKKMGVTALRGGQASAAALLAELPRARYAHLATHGFFADASFRSVLQLDPKRFEQTPRGERVGAGALSPLVMTGLVLAGANDPNTPGRGIVTGESLIDLDLSGLELAVLSACETGLGDVAGGEGTFGLQRAFHLAGCRNVVASLWQVPDDATAALMALFYQNLWEKNLAPLEALRQAQLEIYRNPNTIPKIAESFRGKFDLVGGVAGLKPTADGKAHPLQWAAFTLSGPGR